MRCECEQSEAVASEGYCDCYSNTLCYGESAHFDLDYLNGGRTTVATFSLLRWKQNCFGYLDGSRTTFDYIGLHRLRPKIYRVT
jgi:hypothetical protein